MMRATVLHTNDRYSATARSARSILAMALYVGALGVLGAQVMLIAVVYLMGI